ncbi:tail fiber protein [Robbsia andropogonis]|uniref:tail fiber protein n=1 Tax=Robbsia andropogonis TaxID=28092 RepID=UPI002A6A6352|nr:tail fiber protein [Robbsia andropogonis]
MEDKTFRKNINDAKMAFAAGKVPTQGNFSDLIDTVASAGFTKGMIMMFAGSSIPDGWALCDGSRDGVPDLTGRFILGDALPTASPGKGKQSNHKFTFENPQLSVSPQSFSAMLVGETSEHALVEKELPEHYHYDGVRQAVQKSGPASTEPFPEGLAEYGIDNIPGKVLNPHNAVSTLSQGSYPRMTIRGSHVPFIRTSSTGKDHGHKHQINDTMTIRLDAPFNVSPPCYALAFIIKL